MELAWEHSVENLLAGYERAFSKRTRSAGLIRRAHGQKADQGRQLAMAGDDAGAGTVPVCRMAWIRTARCRLTF